MSSCSCTSRRYNRARIRIPLARIDPEYACLTYVLGGQRVALPLTAASLRETAAVWTAALVAEWFGKDPSKLFFYVPQVGVYQAGGIRVEPEDVEGREP